jgi:hypothetical protein
MSEEIVLPEGEAFFLHPGELALAVTFESVTLPPIWSAGWMAALRWRVWADGARHRAPHRSGLVRLHRAGVL